MVYTMFQYTYALWSQTSYSTNPLLPKINLFLCKILVYNSFVLYIRPLNLVSIIFSLFYSLEHITN